MLRVCPIPVGRQMGPGCGAPVGGVVESTENAQGPLDRRWLKPMLPVSQNPRREALVDDVGGHWRFDDHIANEEDHRQKGIARQSEDPG